MQKTKLQISDQIVRRGASEIVSAILENEIFFSTEDKLSEWVEENFDVNMLGQSNSTYDEVFDLMMEDVHERVREFFNTVCTNMVHKAFLAQKALEYDPSI
jgi:hypothetical protein